MGRRRGSICHQCVTALHPNRRNSLRRFPKRCRSPQLPRDRTTVSTKTCSLDHHSLPTLRGFATRTPTETPTHLASAVFLCRDSLQLQMPRFATSTARQHWREWCNFRTHRTLLRIGPVVRSLSLRRCRPTYHPQPAQLPLASRRKPSRMRLAA